MGVSTHMFNMTLSLSGFPAAGCYDSNWISVLPALKGIKGKYQKQRINWIMYEAFDERNRAPGLGLVIHPTLFCGGNYLSMPKISASDT